MSGGESGDFHIFIGNVSLEELMYCHLVQLSRLVGAAVDHLERLFFCGVRIRSHHELLGESEQILDGEGEGGYELEGDLVIEDGLPRDINHEEWQLLKSGLLREYGQVISLRLPLALLLHRFGGATWSYMGRG